MKKLKVNTGILALILGLSVALLTQSFKAAHQRSSQQWGLNGSTWIKLSEINPAENTYQCSAVSNPPVCTAYFPEEVDPNSDGISEATEVVNARFDLIPVQ